jgi:hypothetical protein
MEVANDSTAHPALALLAIKPHQCLKTKVQWLAANPGV